MQFPVSEPAQFLGLIVVLLGTAKLLGAAAERIGQPSVLGELLAGVLVGALGLVNPNDHKDHVQVALHLTAEAGVVLLLFQIGLETDLAKLLQVGGTSLVVAAVGVVAPFVLGYGVCWMLGLDDLVSLLVAAALTATSVGITGRILADLGRLNAPESRIILGAAVARRRGGPDYPYRRFRRAGGRRRYAARRGASGRDRVRLPLGTLASGHVRGSAARPADRRPGRECS